MESCLSPSCLCTQAHSPAPLNLSAHRKGWAGSLHVARAMGSMRKEKGAGRADCGALDTDCSLHSQRRLGSPLGGLAGDTACRVAPSP